MPLYAPAPRSLARVLRFQAALAAVRAGGGDVPEPDDTPTTTAAILAPVAPEEGAAALRQRTIEQALQLHTALLEEGRATEFAPIVVVRTDGQPVTDADVESDEFPAEVFAEGFSLFMPTSGGLTNAVLGLRTATGSTGAAPPTTPTSPS